MRFLSQAKIVDPKSFTDVPIIDLSLGEAWAGPFRKSSRETARCLQQIASSAGLVEALTQRVRTS